LILYCLQNPGKVVNILRKARATAQKIGPLKDLIETFNSMGIMDSVVYKKSDLTFTFPNGSTITVMGADDEQKIRGLYSDIVWMNEANEFLYDDYVQLAMRCTGKIFLDYNPSANSSWIYEIPEEKSVFIHSTYKMNPFLSKEQVEFIEDFKNTDEAYYKIFALGQRAHSKENVYQEWNKSKIKPDHLTKFLYGADFGVTNPATLVKVWYDDDITEIFIEEIIYDTGLTPSDFVKLLDQNNVEKNILIIADHSPGHILEMRRAGYNVMNAAKDVIAGINSVRSMKITVSEYASNVIKENQLYKWKKINGHITDQVIKQFDHA
jgi:phage terminase large subunit